MDAPIGLHALRAHALFATALALVACSGANPTPLYCGEISAPIFGGATDAGSAAAIDAARAAVVELDTPGGSARCTGTLISPNRVLTAAHCQTGGDVVVRFPPDGRTARSGELAVHPELDMMVIQLPETAVFSATLPSSKAHVDASWVGKQVQMIGYGRTEQNGTGELRFVREAIVDVKPDEIAVDGNGVSGACDGDSGGPLIGVDDDGRLGVLGVLSRGSRSCLGVDVYVRTSAARPWLESLPSAPAGCLDRIMSNP